MAISAEQFKVSVIRLPVFEAATHDVSALFGSLLFRGILMVNVEASGIVHPALNAFPAERFDECNFARPFGFLVTVVSVMPRPLTFRRTESDGAWLSTLLALSVFMPAMGEIASLTAILSCLLAETVDVHSNRLPAMLANDFDGCVSHRTMVSQYILIDKPRYFDIACKRIKREYEQLKLFPQEEKRETVQLKLGDA